MTLTEFYAAFKEAMSSGKLEPIKPESYNDYLIAGLVRVWYKPGRFLCCPISAVASCAGWKNYQTEDYCQAALSIGLTEKTVSKILRGADWGKEVPWNTNKIKKRLAAIAQGDSK